MVPGGCCGLQRAQGAGLTLLQMVGAPGLPLSPIQARNHPSSLLQLQELRQTGDLNLPIMGLGLDIFFPLLLGEQPERNVPTPGVPGQLGCAGPSAAPWLQTT